MPAAVIPHWNRRDLLERLLRNQREQTLPFDEILVVDNGSTDDSVALAERAGARVLRLEQNLGFAAAVNRGIEAVHSDYVAILNNDVTLDPNWLRRTREACQEGAWFATGKILREQNHTIIDGTFDEISRGACAHRCGAGKLDSPTWNRPRRIRMAPMTACLFRTELFHKVGLLDESFGSYLEDVDFGLRCALAGYSGAYVPAAVAYHRGSATWGEWNKATVFQIARNQVLLAAKHFQGQDRWPLMAGQLLWGLLALRHGRGLAWLQGKRAGLEAARKIGWPVEDKRQSLRALVAESEETIRALGEETGLDRYWRAYFWLSPR